VVGVVKSRIRAWLIDLVREAIRTEFPERWLGLTEAKRTEVAYNPYGNARVVTLPQRPASKPVTPLTEPSFEQMQLQAIQEQEKYYAQPK
jgi:hypothetical protein